MWKQVKDFSIKNAGTRKGWCLQNVRLGYGIRAKYASAWAAWLALPVKHTDRNFPKGVDTPIYFYYKNANNGHIGVLLANGKFWSDGDIYASLEAYEKKHPAVKFRGWGEAVNDKRVIKYVRHMETVKLWTWYVRNKSVNGKVIGVVKGGQRYETQVLKNGWRKITFKGKAGYVGPAAWR